MSEESYVLLNTTYTLSCCCNKKHLQISNGDPMKLKIDDIQIAPDDIFLNDKANREPAVKAIANLLSIIDSNFVLAIDSPWGNGKTTFIRLLKTYLENENYRCLYFNAWESDFSKDPLIALTGELKQLVKKNDARQSIYDEITKTGIKLARKSLPITLQFLSAGSIDIETTKSLIKTAKSEFQNEYLDNLVDSYESEKKLIKLFHTLVNNFISEKDSEENDTVIILIDELDRCRPTYAIELLERLKHIFNIQDLVFVLALDKSQLGHSLSAIYGQGINSNEYLRRFIDLEYLLPIQSGKVYTEYLIQKFDLPAKYEYWDQAGSTDFMNTFSTLSDLLSLSLRARNQCFTRIAIAILSTKENRLLPISIVAILTILKTISPDLYSRFVFEKGTVGEVIDYLKKADKADLLSTPIGAYIIACLIFTQSHKGDPKELIEYKKIYQKQRKSDMGPTASEHFACKVITSHNTLVSSFSLWSEDFVISKIEIASRFE